MTIHQSILIERDGPIATVSFNRPISLNAIEASIRAELGLAIKEVNEDDNIRVVILTGVGRAFCAGADLTETLPEGASVEDGLNEQYKPVLMAISNAPKPWISAVNGAAAGIGSAFAMACDLTLMADDAYLYQAFAAIGLIPDGGATWHLAHTIGRKKAFELIAFGEKLKATDCLQLGLCNKVVPADKLMEEAKAMAIILASKAPLSLRYAKEAMNAAMSHDLANTISIEARLQEICANSDDAKEGGQAFLEKRAAVFSGR
ncbi:enoyl-CoA hydratase/isomerase family protein [Paraglaciecola arctica]|uniref:Enoyl-CoA hydratase/isomerase family protein n=1 Tax=Paraglaciecola arctica BSs20135 TaxID=493475 RepID=K6Z841_9ALTE|nr:enoyl-CoA hydratase-related protein [Paraglaciecola arctica]GAC19625.1 enoyl-CoA hydratase/isomerase family protein [Paraglaciecola arctica BSs20135]